MTSTTKRATETITTSGEAVQQRKFKITSPRRRRATIWTSPPRNQKTNGILPILSTDAGEQIMPDRKIHKNEPNTEKRTHLSTVQTAVGQTETGSGNYHERHNIWVGDLNRHRWYNKATEQQARKDPNIQRNWQDQHRYKPERHAKNFNNTCETMQHCAKNINKNKKKATAQLTLLHKYANNGRKTNQPKRPPVNLPTRTSTDGKTKIPRTTTSQES